MTTTNAPPDSKRPSEPNASKSSQINRSNAKLIICYENNTKCPPDSKRPSEPNDSKSSQIDRFGAMLIIFYDNNKCAARF